MFDQPAPPSSPSLRRRRQVILRRRRIGAGGAVVLLAGLTVFLLLPSSDPPAPEPAGTPEATTAVPPDGASPHRVPTAPPQDATPAEAVDPVAGLERHAAALMHARAELRRFPQAWPVVRGVYATMWTFAGQRWDELMALVRDTEINAVVVDVKDDAGFVAWQDSEVALARETGADGHSGQSRARARARIQSLRQAGGYPIARIVCFKDDVAASARPSLAIASAGGGVWRDDRGNAWLDPNLRANWDYLVDLGREAARLGFLEVQFDYVRFPTDGPTDAAVYRSGGVDPTSIRDFLAYARERLHAAGVRVSADIFGLTTYKPRAAGDGDGTGQLFEDVVSEVDYVSPMVYPSHYYPGNYGLENPEAQPYAVVVNAMREARERVTGYRARVRPWLEDFSLSVPHHPGRVSAQLRATYENGIDSWLLWNAGNRYSAGALDSVLRPKAARDRRGLRVRQADATGGGEESLGGSADRAPGTGLRNAELRKLNVNELGRVLVLEWHEIKDADGRWSNSLATFERQIQELYERGYRPVTAQEFASGRFPIPAGTTPVVLTFDDSSRQHLFFGPDGRPHPDSVVGVLEAFSREHPDWRATAVFAPYWPTPFREPGDVERKLRWLVANGYELSNHSYGHDDLSAMSPGEAQKSLARSEMRLREVVPDARMRTLTLPFGRWPDPPSLALTGAWNGHTYRHDLVFLVGSMPARSPHHVDHDPTAVQRVQSYLPEYRKWLDWMDAAPHRRFVSDGEPGVVTYPAVLDGVAAPRDGLDRRVYHDPPADGG